MSISNSAIQKQFRTKLDTIDGIPSEDNRAWENREFSPTKNTPWLREQHIPGDEITSANGERRAVGFMQYDYFVPIGHSIYEAKDVADSIKNAFAPDSVLGGLVRVDASRTLAGQKDTGGTWYQIPIQIDYTVYSIT